MKQLFSICLLAFATVAGADSISPKPDITVSADGTGNFTNIQSALESIPKTNTERIVVFIKNGLYHEKIRVDAPFVTLHGESRKGARIEFPQLNDDFTKTPDELGRAVINLSKGADDFVLENLTAENTAGVVGPHSFTIYGVADRTVVVDCDVLSHGADTISLWLGDRGRYYHARCNFSGSVDFICPRGWCYVTDCTFYEWKAGSAATWHDGSKGQDMKFVLRNCKFDGTNGWVLARHHIEAQFYYLDCKFSQTMADKQPKRVIYPVDKAATNSAALATNEANAKKNLDLDSKNIWGERAYFWNCLHDGGDFAWHSNNLASAVGAPTAEQITAAWTFAGKWNPENKVGPKILSVKAEMGRVTLTFSERVTVKAKPKLVLNNGGLADFASGSGSDTLAFEITGASDKPGKAVSLDLNGGAIIATEASATLRPAEIAWPK